MRWILMGIVVSGLWVNQTSAQGFVEGLFRTIAEAQMERERRDALPPRRIEPIPNRPQAPIQIPYRAPVEVRPPAGRGSADSVDTWNNLAASLQDLRNQIQRDANRDASLRGVVADVYRVAAQSRSMADAAAAGRDDQVATHYSSFDQSYRTLSYSIRSAASTGDESRAVVRQSDRYINRLAWIYNVDPQWDRVRLNEIILISETQVRTMLDDLELISLPADRGRSIAHDLRLLIRQLADVRRDMATMSADQAAQAFTRFTAAFTPLARDIRTIRDPHLDRRLDSLSKLADETYELLWMQPPVTSSRLVESARRIESAADQLRDRLDQRTLQSLDPNTRDRVQELARSIDREGHEIVHELERNPTGRSTAEALRRIDAASLELVRLTRYLPGSHQAALTTIRQETEALQRSTGTPSGSQLNPATLLTSAATLEGTAETLRDALRRVDRYVQPVAFRGDLRRASDDFFRTTRDFHEAVADRRDGDEIRRRASAMIEPWQSLFPMVKDIARHGVDSRDASVLSRYIDGAAPAMGEVAAVLGL